MPTCQAAGHAGPAGSSITRMWYFRPSEPTLRLGPCGSDKLVAFVLGMLPTRIILVRKWIMILVICRMKHLAGLATSQSRSQWGDGPTESRLDQSVAAVGTGSRLLPRTKAWLDTSRAGVDCGIGGCDCGPVVKMENWDSGIPRQSYGPYSVRS